MKGSDNMAKTKHIDTKTKAKKTGRPALTPEGRESQMIALAVDLAEEQLRDGTASSQVITHFLKLGTEKEKLEREKLNHENELLKAKTESLKSAQNVEALYKEALEAMRSYRGDT
jgi:hypothetical protein